MKALILVMALMASGITHGQNLNSLSPAEYDKFYEAMVAECSRNPQDAGEKAEAILVGMLGLEGKPEARRIFQIDVLFNVNSMLLLVSNANKLKREPAFMENYQKQVAAVKKQLSDDGEIAILTALSELMIRQNQNLP